MLTVIWSTPRTGSNWYFAFLKNKLLEENKLTTCLKQYFNPYELTHYIKANDTDYIANFETYAYFTEFYMNPLVNRINKKNITSRRWRTLNQEIDYRIDLLEKHDNKKYPLLVSQHISPIDLKAYTYLRSVATKNIFLYRRNFIDQLSSYALASHTKIFRKAKDHQIPVLTNVFVERQILKGMAEKIKEFWKHDMTGGELVAYEDINFQQYKKISKLNVVPAFEQLSSQTKLDILELDEEFQNFILQQKISL